MPGMSSLVQIPSNNSTQLWKIAILNGKTHYKWPCSIVMQQIYNQRVWRVPCLTAYDIRPYGPPSIQWLTELPAENHLNSTGSFLVGGRGTCTTYRDRQTWIIVAQTWGTHLDRQNSCKFMIVFMCSSDTIEPQLGWSPARNSQEPTGIRPGVGQHPRARCLVSRS